MLEVSGGLQLADGSHVCVRQTELLSKLAPEIIPVQEPALVLVLLTFLPSEYLGSPFGHPSRFPRGPRTVSGPWALIV